MESINAKQLAYLLGISVKDANKKIMLALYEDYQKAKLETEMNPNGLIEIDLFEKKTGIPIRLAMEDIRMRALERKSFAKYLMRDYPEQQLSVENPKKLIRLPEGLRTLLNPETLSEIKKYWNDNYYGKKIAKWHKSVDYFPELNP